MTSCAAYRCGKQIDNNVSPWCDSHRPDWAVVATTDPTPWRYWPQYGQNEVREVRFASQRDAFASGASHAVFAPRAEGFELA